jgi:hypothetical protein
MKKQEDQRELAQEYWYQLFASETLGLRFILQPQKVENTQGGDYTRIHNVENGQDGECARIKKVENGEKANLKNTHEYAKWRMRKVSIN